MIVEVAAHNRTLKNKLVEERCKSCFDALLPVLSDKSFTLLLKEPTDVAFRSTLTPFQLVETFEELLTRWGQPSPVVAPLSEHDKRETWRRMQEHLIPGERFVLVIGSGKWAQVLVRGKVDEGGRMRRVIENVMLPRWRLELAEDPGQDLAAC